jgi:serine protease Do
MKIIPLIISLFIISTSAFSQSRKTLFRSYLNESLSNSILKAFPASVKLYAYDTIAGKQAGPQFSGVVATSNGYILTVAHTTIPGKIYLVNFPDGKKALAEALGRIVLAAQPTLPDVSLMKIKTAGNWPFAQMGNITTLKLNQPCIGISYPETLNQNYPTIRYGKITNVKTAQGMIESTCKMEPGDSGGPLFDLDGNIIGLHSAIDTGEWINFDVPVAIYQEYWNALQVPKTYDTFPEIKEITKPDDLKKSIAFVPYSEPVILENIRKKANESTIKIESKVKGKASSILGTIVITNYNKRLQTYIISKSSEVGDTVVIFHKGRRFKPMVIYRDKANDLVLLSAGQIFNKGLTYNQLARDTVTHIQPGSFLFSNVTTKTPIIGVASSGVFSSMKITSLAYLGAFIDIRVKGFPIKQIMDSSPAFHAGIKEGDFIVAINKQAISNPEDFGEQLTKLWPGDTVTIQILRSERLITLKVTMGAWPIHVSDHPADHFAGGKSLRRDGFLKVFAHDATVQANQIGGPVFNYQGELLGVNIARFSRTACLALPTSEIVKFLSRYLTTNQQDLHK